MQGSEESTVILMVSRLSLLPEERGKEMRNLALWVALAMGTASATVRDTVYRVTSGHTKKADVMHVTETEESPVEQSAEPSLLTQEAVMNARSMDSTLDPKTHMVPLALYNQSSSPVLLASTSVPHRLSIMLGNCMQKYRTDTVGPRKLEPLPVKELEPTIPHFSSLQPGTDITNTPFRYGHGDTEVQVTLSEHVGDIVLSGSRGTFRIAKLSVASVLSEGFSPDTDDPYHFSFTITSTGVSVCIERSTEVLFVDRPIIVPLGRYQISRDHIEERFEMAANSVSHTAQTFTVADMLTSADFERIPE